MTADERVTPHDLEAEKSILGTILLHPERFAEAAAIVGPDDFFRTAHRTIFSHMRTIIERGDVLDFVVLRTSLANAGDLDAVDGPAYITALVDGIPRASNLPEYARLVKEKATARLLLAYCEQARDEFSRDTSALSNGAGTRFAEAVRRVIDDAHGSAATHGLDPAYLTDAVDVVREGRSPLYGTPPTFRPAASNV